MACCAGPARVSRTCLIMVNVLLAAGAVLLLSVSIDSLVEDEPRISVLVDAPVARGTALLLLAVGILALLLSLIGCCGALCRSQCLIGLHGVISLLLFVLSVACFVSALLLVGPKSGVAEKSMIESMSRYGNDTGVTNVWDFVQREFHCCGVLNGGDWIANATIPGVVPDSCCRYVNGSQLPCTESPTAENSYNDTGCLSSALHLIGDHEAAFGAASAAVAIFLMMSTIMAFCFIRSHRQAAYERITV